MTALSAVATKVNDLPLLMVMRRGDLYDPTRTTVLRNAFAKEMGKRFRALRGAIRRKIVDDDCFGLRELPSGVTRIVAQAGDFDFPRSQDKITAFMEWMSGQVDRGILQVEHRTRLGSAIEDAWTNVYIKDTYERGVQRARYELRGAGYGVPSIEETGGIAASMTQPPHADRLGVLYTRAFTGLKGITEAMDLQISQVLAQGIADGDHPRRLASKLNKAISGIGEDLGVRDTLGRWIPAERRAKMLARTEIIRAHHQGMIQEYRNWGQVGIRVRAEWQTAGDMRVCPECLEMEMRGSWTLEEIENMIPLHPACFIDPQIPVYTSTGWRPIGNIRVGDLVLTHRGRFRKVYGLPRSKGRPEVVRIDVEGLSNSGMTVTSNHPVLVSVNDKIPPIWREAGECQVGDKLMMLAGRCARCGEKAPYWKKYCSRRCLSLDITDRQWANEHRKNISEKASRQMQREFADGTRDRFAVTKAANEKVRKLVAEGKWNYWQDESFFEKIRKVTNLDHHRKASSKRMKANNPMHDPVIAKKVSEAREKYFTSNPERRLNARMAKYRKSGRMNSIEKRMAKLLDRLGVEYVFQYPILRYDVDFAIPSLRIAIECDGVYWHRGNEERDAKRQANIEAEGWFVLRYTDEIINRCLEEIESELCRVLANHTGQYEFIGLPIRSIKKWTVKRADRWLYNLSVEEDESYIAKGLAVHNCRCIALPLAVGEEPGEALPPEETLPDT